MGAAAIGLAALSGAFEDTEDVDQPPEIDEEAEDAREEERRRLRRVGSSDTRVSSSLPEALNAQVGRRTLGGAE